MRAILHRRIDNLCALAMLLFAVSLCEVSVGETINQVVNPKKVRNEWVSDMAGVIDGETERSLNVLIDRLEQKTTAEIAVVTIRRTDGRTPKEFATELLNRWGVGKKGKDNGVLVLLVMEERRIEVETGYGVEDVLPDGKVGEILDTHVIPRFKRGDFGGGIFAGVRAIAEVIAGEALDTAPQPAPLPTSPAGQAGQISPSSARSSEPPLETPEPSLTPPLEKGGRGDLVSFGGMGLVAILLALVGYGVWRSRIHRCPKCGKQMRRLTEEQDDVYLSFAQKFEEELGSVDYRVWRCDDCQTCKIKRAVRWFSGYENCPKCEHRTVYVKSYILREPTYERDGQEEVTRTCRFPRCAYHHSKQHRVPRLQLPTQNDSSRSSMSSSGGSSDSGSFGGGSSGGGGAGRSW